MWVIIVLTAAQVVLAWGLMELMYRDNYWCYSVPYEDGSMEIICSYIP